MSSSLRDSVVRITSSNPDESSFGTGFVIYQDEQATYVVTCAHVVNDVGGPKSVKAGGVTASVIAPIFKENVEPAVLGEDGVDLAVLRVVGLQNKPLLHVSDTGETGKEFTTAGFQQYFKNKSFLIRELRGVLGEQVGVEARDLFERIEAWDLEFTGKYQLKPGYSGSPVVEASGTVIGIVSTREGGEKGVAIAIKALKEIWSDMPDSLLQEYGSLDHQATAKTSQHHFIQYLENFILQMPTQENVLRSISNSFDYYIIQPDCETLANQLNKVCAPFLDLATSLNQSTDLEVKKRRIWLINALLDFNRQAKVVEDNINRFCEMYGVVLEDDQPVGERQKIHKQLDDLTKFYRSVFEAAKGLYDGLGLKH